MIHYVGTKFLRNFNYLKDSQVLPISYPHVIDIPVTRSYEKVSLSNKVWSNSSDIQLYKYLLGNILNNNCDMTKLMAS